MSELSPSNIAVLLLAAGASSRMRGADKLLQNVAGEPCVRAMARRVLSSGCPLFVTLPDLSHPRAAVLDGVPATLVPVPEAALGMAHSIRAGVAALPAQIDAVMILPADMPAITAEDIARLCAEFHSLAPTILRATTEDGTPGHPVIFARSLFPSLLAIEGDTGAASIIRGVKDVATLPLAGNHARLDLDTPEDWADWHCATLPQG